ncbi:MAG: ImmA/IrrE family metallo-endopeptidase [Oscillospiraceae bacterium]|nr:ImmA/IrrE family metallo-endopeptidase [Oscillospiraceae bacterium]
MKTVLFNRKKYTLSAREMIEMEKWLRLECIPKIGDALSEEEISSILKLKVEYVDSANLEAHVEAELVPIDDSKYNGLIRVNNECRGKAFAYLHEIIHYAYDVGIGKKVSTPYTRKSKGHTENKHEQKINYMAAALCMRYEKIDAQIQAYDASRPKMDELKFVSGLCREFNQPRPVVIRRIQEVRRIKRQIEKNTPA